MSLFGLLPAMMAWRQRDSLARSSAHGRSSIRMVPGGDAVLGGVGLLAVGVIANQASAHVAQLVAAIGEH